MTEKICPKCGARARRPSVIEYRSTIRLDRRDVDVFIPDLPVEACGACGEHFMGDAADYAIDEALRRSAGLLTASQMESARATLGIPTQLELAESIGIAPATLSRWMQGHVVQSRLADSMLRVFFAVPEARSFLRALHHRGAEAVPFVVADRATRFPRRPGWTAGAQPLIAPDGLWTVDPGYANAA